MTEFITTLKTPFPRPKANKTNFLWIICVGLGASLFILLYKPFGIENTTGELYVDLIIFSLGILFILSILFIEFLVPKLIPRPFQKWTLGRALVWYPIVIVFIGGTQFLYKSWWGDWHDFTVQEFLLVLARTLGIGMTVAFIVLGIWQYLNQRKISALTSKETYTLTTPQGNEIKVNLNNILFVASDDNYVDLHIEEDGKRDKIMLRSTLKNIESQLINPISPIKRCHRRYLINPSKFNVANDSNKKMTIRLNDYDDQIPVSAQYMSQIRKELEIRP